MRTPKSTPLVQRFNVDLGLIPDQLRDIDLRHDALKDRLDALVNRVTLGKDKMNVLQPLLSMSHDPEELTILGKSLCKIAEFIKDYDDLAEKLNMLQIIKNDPNWFISSFADLSVTVENQIDELMQSNDSLRELESSKENSK